MKKLHRVLVENLLGRELATRETVHHIDEDKMNNTLGNLFLFRHKSAHQRWHKFLDRHSLDGKILESNLNLLAS
ncbi:MAG: HNH endonuclease [Chloracidobacterium sp.]|nr:HNH endonuclease [Chloracidobacterium sp.]